MKISINPAVINRKMPVKYLSFFENLFLNEILKEYPDKKIKVGAANEKINLNNNECGFSNTYAAEFAIIIIIIDILLRKSIATILLFFMRQRKLN
jgi:hypothetical protein